MSGAYHRLALPCWMCGYSSREGLARTLYERGDEAVGLSPLLFSHPIVAKPTNIWYNRVYQGFVPGFERIMIVWRV